MRNFLQFIWNNQFTLLFFLLEFIGFALLTTNNGFHNSKIQTASTSISGNVADIRDSYAQYLGLKEENEKLLEENKRLKERISLREGKNRNQKLPFIYQTAHAINSTYSLGNNFLILDKGASEGVTAQQAVVGPQGIIGVVHSVSDHYSTVMPIIHSQSTVSCKLKKNNYFGLLKWRGNDDRLAVLEDIPNHIGVFTGDTIVTRGGEGIFPSNILVGKAVSSEKNEATGFQAVTVELATDFRNVYNVYVLENKAKPEVDSLIQIMAE
jgi:rod shape-determining protein MreC